MSTDNYEMQADVNGERLVLDCAGALWWPAERTLVFSDIHFEKGSSLARFGALIPPYDTRTSLRRMAALIGRYAPDRVIALGDSFHDRDAANRLDDYERTPCWRRSWPARIGYGSRETTIPSRQPGSAARSPTRSASAASSSAMNRRPPPQPGEIAGHLHPCATVTLRGHSLRRRCFASDGTRMVMPAFGAYAGGLSVADPAIASLFGGAFAAYMLGGRRVYAVPARGTPRFTGIAAAR